MCDEISVDNYNVTKKCDNIKLVNRSDILQHDSRGGRKEIVEGLINYS